MVKKIDDDDLQDEFSGFVDKKSFYKLFKNKNFNSDEIRTIVNLLSENKYNQLDIKHINLSRDIYFLGSVISFIFLITSRKLKVKSLIA